MGIQEAPQAANHKESENPRKNPVGPGDHFTLEVELENTSKDADIEDMVVKCIAGSSLFIGGDTNTGSLAAWIHRESR